MSANENKTINIQPSQNGYSVYHESRIAHTLQKLRDMGASRLVEVGSHPGAMTSAFVDDGAFQICATVSAQEVTNWPDDIGVTASRCQLATPKGNVATFTNYSANIERTLFEIEEKPDTVVAAEIIEHLTRSPHIMLLNINHWLPLGGKLFITTPNGAQFSNPLRRGTQTAAYRCNTYERHSYVFTLDGLTDLVKLCGFRIVEASYWDVIARTGPSAVYGWLANVPVPYFREKFKKTLVVVAEKDRDVVELERCPRVYDSRGDWEYVAKNSADRL